MYQTPSGRILKTGNLQVNERVKEALYKQAGRLLEFINNLEPDRQIEERMVAVNARTGELIVDNFKRDGDWQGTGFLKEEQRNIDECLDMIILILFTDDEKIAKRLAMSELVLLNQRLSPKKELFDVREL